MMVFLCEKMSEDMFECQLPGGTIINTSFQGLIIDIAAHIKKTAKAIPETFRINLVEGLHGEGSMQVFEFRTEDTNFGVQITS